MKARIRNRLLLLTIAVAGIWAEPPNVSAQSPDGFLFRAPNLTLTARLGYAFPTLRGDLVDFTTERLTVSESDFDTPLIGGELAILVSQRLDVIVGGGYASGASTSEFRDWVGEDDLPIVQDTRFHRSYLTGGAKLYFTDRGTTVGSFAWVPAAVAPYASVGIGGAWYSFEQEGEFVDYETLDVFVDRFASSGGGFTAQAALGLDVAWGTRMFLNGEGRYSWAEAGLDQDFVGFGTVDLSGFQATVGLGFRL